MMHPYGAPQRDGLPGSEPLMIITAGAIGVAATVCGLCWLAAALAVLLAGHGWPGGPDGAAPFTVRLITTGDPDRAWATTAHTAAGPTWLFWLLLALLVGAVAVLAAYGIRWWRGREPAADDGARWAPRRAEHEMAVPDEPAERRGRIVAGRGKRSGRLLAAGERISACVFGPTGSGKTLYFVVPNALEWPGPMVISTTRGPDLNHMIDRRAELGPVWIVAPAGVKGRRTACWSPVDYADDELKAWRMADWLAQASGMGEDRRAKPWISEASSAIGGLLLAANSIGGGIEQFIDWAQAGRHAAETVRATLISAGHRHVAREYGKTWQLHPDGVGSVEFTLHGLTKAYRDPQVRSSAARTDFTAAELLGRNGTLFIVDPPTDADDFAPMFTALIASVIHAAEKTYEQTGRTLDPYLGLFLDEAGNVFRYPGLGRLLSNCRDMGIVPVTMWHDLAQLENLYGQAEARTILSQSKLRLLLPGCADITTLDYWSRMLGQTVTTRTGRSYATDGRHTSSTSQHQEALAPLHVLQQINPGEAIMQYDHLPPMRIRLRNSLTDKRLLHLKHDATVTQAEPRTQTATQSHTEIGEQARPDTEEPSGPETGTDTGRGTAP